MNDRPVPLIPLAELTPADAGQVGGKAHALGQLVREGFPVPPGSVIPTTVFERALRSADLWAASERAVEDPDAARSLREAIQTMPLPADLADAWVAEARRLGPRLAVRSSAIGEDGADRSFAGQLTTSLSVPPEEVLDAIRTCWASLYAPSALAYRGPNGPAAGSIAVLLQQMVQPECSGVLFTINPLNGSWREMVVEAVWGLGEGLVSGQLTPHWYLLRRPRRWPTWLRSLAERVRVRVVDEDLPPLRERVVGALGGSTVREPTPPPLVRQRTLTRQQVVRLCRIGLRLEATFGSPQDVEWARTRDGRFFVLQTRPITATGSPRAQSVLWTRRFIGERWPQPATPLAWSILAPIFSWFIAFDDAQVRHLGGGPPLKLIQGRPYLNTTVFRHLAFKLPGTPSPRFMMELIPPDEERAWQTRFAVAPDLAVYASILRQVVREERWRRFEFNPLTNPERWQRFVDRLALALPDLQASSDDPARLVALADEQQAWIREYIGIHICSLLFANIFWQLLEGALATTLPHHPQLMQALAVSPRGNLTTSTNQALFELAATASPTDLDALEGGKRDALSVSFGEALGTFLDRFGHRAEASWELMTPRWSSEPARLTPLLRALASGNSQSPRARSQEREARYVEARREVAAELTGWHRQWVGFVIDQTRTYLLLRENQRFWFDHLLSAVQSTLKRLGRRLVQRGVLPREEDVALLSWPELRRLSLGAPAPADLTNVLRQRADDQARYALADPPTFLVDDDAPVLDGPDAQRIQGLGISSGRVTGRVRIVRTVDDGDRIEPGDILVTRSVDPGWTSLFQNVAGAVLEMGSVLSHGAVLAREYGIPAIVNIDGATQRLQEGAWVTLDGHRGVLWIHGDMPPETA
ncbi:MAG: PEP/pyruvate-binding domain-containing protein [Myxococcota bacterium]